MRITYFILHQPTQTFQLPEGYEILGVQDRTQDAAIEVYIRVEPANPLVQATFYATQITGQFTERLHYAGVVPGANGARLVFHDGGKS